MASMQTIEAAQMANTASLFMLLVRSLEPIQLLGSMLFSFIKYVLKMILFSVSGFHTAFGNQVRQDAVAVIARCSRLLSLVSRRILYA
jgi:hypothetical protein